MKMQHALTGIGAGILSDGRVLRGAFESAGAVGWMALERPYFDKFDDCGNFETYASGAGIPKLAIELMAADYTGQLRRTDGELIANDVFAAFDSGDEVAQAVVARCIELWGMAAANLISLFNPQKLIFGGGVFGPAIRFLPEIYAEAKKWAQPVAMKQVRIEPSSLGNHAGLFGAGFLAMRNLEQKAIAE